MQVYYDYFTHQTYRGDAKGKNVTVPAALHQVPLLIQGGSILPTRERPRRSSPLMKRDPFTLRIALDKAGYARGELYLDDGVTFSHQQGQIVWREFTSGKQGKGFKVSSRDLAKTRPSEAVDGVALATYDPANQFAKSIEDVRVERIVVLGLPNKPSSVKIVGGVDAQWEFTPGVAASGKQDGVASVLTLKNPKVNIAADWEILIA